MANLTEGATRTFDIKKLILWEGCLYFESTPLWIRHTYGVKRPLMRGEEAKVPDTEFTLRTIRKYRNGPDFYAWVMEER